MTKCKLIITRHIFFCFQQQFPKKWFKNFTFFVFLSFFLFFFLFLPFLLSVLSSEPLLSSFSPVPVWNYISDGNRTSGSKLVNNFSLTDCTVQAGLKISGKITPELHNTKIPIDCINSKVQVTKDWDIKYLQLPWQSHLNQYISLKLIRTWIASSLKIFLEFGLQGIK